MYMYVYIKFTYTVEQAFSLLPFVFLPLKEERKKEKEGRKKDGQKLCSFLEPSRRK